MTKPFKPPTMAEAKEFATSIGFYTFDVAKWWHFYNSKNWMVGKNKMQNWKSAVWTWFTDTPEYRELKRQERMTKERESKQRYMWGGYIRDASEIKLIEMRNAREWEWLYYLIDELRPEIKGCQTSQGRRRSLYFTKRMSERRRT